MTLKQAENFHHQLYGESWKQKEFFGLIRRFHLSEDKAIKAYSRGMKMQLGMALALSHGAKILLIFAGFSWLSPKLKDLFEVSEPFADLPISILTLGLITLTIILNFLSVGVSINIFKKKEF